MIKLTKSDDADKLSQKLASSGYTALHIQLTKDDIEHLLLDGLIYDVCNGEYGVTVELDNDKRINLSKAEIVKSRLQNGFIVPVTIFGERQNEDIDDMSAIAAMLTQFLFKPEEISLHKHEFATFDDSKSLSQRLVIFDDNSRLLLNVEDCEVNEIYAFLITIDNSEEEIVAIGL